MIRGPGIYLFNFKTGKLWNRQCCESGIFILDHNFLPTQIQQEQKEGIFFCFAQPFRGNKFNKNKNYFIPEKIQTNLAKTLLPSSRK